MYALINKLNDKLLHVDVAVSKDGFMTYHAMDDGELPLVHATSTHMTLMLEGNYPDYEHSYQYPSLEDVELADYELRELYLSPKDLADVSDY